MASQVAAFSDVIFVARASAATPGRPRPPHHRPRVSLSLYPGYGTYFFEKTIPCKVEFCRPTMMKAAAFALPTCSY
jgi:hypothetical protein